jgi:hypothetical protein
MISYMQINWHNVYHKETSMITFAGVYVTVYDVLAETQNSNLYPFAIYQFCELFECDFS